MAAVACRRTLLCHESMIITWDAKSPKNAKKQTFQLDPHLKVSLAQIHSKNLILSPLLLRNQLVKVVLAQCCNTIWLAASINSAAEFTMVVCSHPHYTFTGYLEVP